MKPHKKADSEKRDNAPSDKKPRIKSLKLEFSKAADYDRINALFDPAIKNIIDPNGYVVKRLEKDFKAAIDGNRVAMLSDRNKEVQSLTFAYHISANDNGKKIHKYTEIGTTLSLLQGYNAAQLVVAAMALKEWQDNPPKDKIVTEILPGNGASFKTYKDYMGWNPIKDKKISSELHHLCNEIIAPESQGNQTIWFNANKRTRAQLAQIILDFIKQGGLVNKRTNDKIPVDFSALKDAGLTKKKLKKIAKGLTP